MENEEVTNTVDSAEHVCFDILSKVLAVRIAEQFHKGVEDCA